MQTDPEQVEQVEQVEQADGAATGEADGTEAASAKEPRQPKWPRGSGVVAQIWELYDRFRVEERRLLPRDYIGSAVEAGYNRKTATKQFYLWQQFCRNSGVNMPSKEA